MGAKSEGPLRPEPAQSPTGLKKILPAQFKQFNDTLLVDTQVLEKWE
jgi:hypothetical protein